ncbi:MAG: beta-galactosidase [Lachnospiraceae bacterium]|nr:beta-galactosidase [Lachnospiraceae bacterium]
MDRLTVRDHNGAPTLFINEKPVPAMLHLRCKVFGEEATGPDRFTESFKDAGFSLMSVLSEEFVNFDKAWDPETDTFKKEAFAGFAALRAYAQKWPDTKFLIRVHPEPRGADSPWLKMHPEEWEINQDGVDAFYPCPSYASRVWMKDAKRYLVALMESLVELGLEDNLLGLLIGGADSGEWVKIGPMEDWAADYSAPMQKAFSEWLKNKYQTVENLRKAWGNPEADFENPVPSPEAQGAAELYLMKDPVKNRDSIDHFHFLADLVAQDIIELCEAAESVTDHRHLMGVFYGYLHEMVWNNGFFGQGRLDADVDHSAAARSGHGGLRKTLDSPAVDFFCSPVGYGFRGIGGEAGFMSPEESVRLAGKLWISEEDIRTFHYPEDAGYGKAETPEETVTIMTRQFSNLLVHGAGAWFCDWWHSGKIGVFDDPKVMDAFAQMMKLANLDLNLPDRGSSAEVAVVIDAYSSFYRSTRNNFDMPNWRNRAWGLARMGVPTDYVMLDDILSGKAKEYKLYFMMNTFHFSDADRALIRERLYKDNKVILWLWAPGFLNDDRMDVTFCRELTEMPLRQYSRQWSPNLYLSDFEHPITQNLPTSTYWGTDMRLGPLFTVEKDPAVRELGTVVIQQGRSETGFAIRENETYTTVYSAGPNIPPGVLRELARYAGVHVFTEEEDVMYANGHFVMLHTVRGGDKTIRLPKKTNVWDAFTGRKVAENTHVFTDRMERRTTRLYFYGETFL